MGVWIPLSDGIEKRNNLRGTCSLLLGFYACGSTVSTVRVKCVSDTAEQPSLPQPCQCLLFTTYLLAYFQPSICRRYSYLARYIRHHRVIQVVTYDQSGGTRLTKASPLRGRGLNSALLFRFRPFHSTMQSVIRLPLCPITVLLSISRVRESRRRP